MEYGYFNGIHECSNGVEKSAAREKNALALEAFLLSLDIATFDTESALVYGNIRAELERKRKPSSSMDMPIAAQAIAQDFTLITHNLKEFEQLPDLRCGSNK